MTSLLKLLEGVHIGVNEIYISLGTDDEETEMVTHDQYFCGLHKTIAKEIRWITKLISENYDNTPETEEDVTIYLKCDSKILRSYFFSKFKLNMKVTYKVCGVIGTRS